MAARPPRPPARDGARRDSRDASRGPSRDTARRPARESARGGPYDASPRDPGQKAPRNSGPRDAREPGRRDWQPPRDEPRDDAGMPARGLERRGHTARREDSRARSYEDRREPAGRARREPAPAPLRSEPRERKVHGINACRAIASQRPDDIIRGYFAPSAARQFGPLMRELAASRRAYHLVDPEELDAVTETQHHEGVCLLVRDHPSLSFEAWLRQAPAGSACVLALDGVANPHNIGAILRIAAHFGAAAVVLPDVDAGRSGAARRTAEGGAEWVPLVEAPDFAPMMQRARQAGFEVVTTSSHARESVFERPLPARCLLLVGEEGAGLRQERLNAGDRTVKIPGTGQIDSLNVSVATGILMAEHWRCHAR